MVTSLFTSIFSSTNTLKNRIESIQDAEEKLLEIAYKMGGDTDVEIKIFDTILPKSSIPCLNQENTKCLLLGLNNPNTVSKDTSQYDDDWIIHGMSAESKGENKIPLVLLHGYANGALYFYRNIKHLATKFTRVYAIDMLGWGLSSRPNYPFSHKTISEIEEFYIDSLEQWRVQNNISKMYLGGHSLGGYVSVAYSEKYPEHVEKLILLSPVGVPDKSKEEEEMDLQKIKNAPFTFRMLATTAMTFWSGGITPGSFIRAFPEGKGRGLVEGYIQKRLPNITEEQEQTALINYLYYNAKLPGSGEYCLSKLLKPMAYAYRPLLHRIPKLRVKDISILYGDKDWMDPKGGSDVIELCKKMKESGLDAPNVDIFIVRDAGHLLMLENWAEFNDAVIKAVNS